MPGQFIPPNGFAGFAQQTSAVQSLYRSRRNGGSRKRRAKASPMRAKKKRAGKRASARGGKARLVKGSAAAKRYMAKIRKKRK